MSLIAQKLISASGATEATDDDFNLVTGLCHFDGSNGAQNKTFLDSSTNGFTVTRQGSTSQGTFTPFSADEGKWSASFDGTDDYLEVASSSDFDYTSSLCVDGWFWMTQTPGTAQNAHCIVSRWAATSGDRAFLIDVESTGLRVIVNQGGSTNVTVCDPGSSGAVSLNEWHHCALTWDGTTYRAFLDGGLEGSATGNAAPTGNGRVVRIGHNTNTHYFGGYISNVRIVVDGGAIYTSAFTPPTTPSTAISGTELLTSCSNRFKDKSTSARTITPSSKPKIQPFSPFSPSAAYNSAVNGGAGYFDGSGDYLTVPDSTDFDFGSGEFTVEAWIYGADGGSATGSVVYNQSVGGATSDSAVYFGAGTSGVSLYVSTSGSSWTGPNQVASVTVDDDAWHHCVWQRRGNLLEIYVDGTQAASTSFSGTIYNSSRNVEIGAQNGGGTFKDYISDLRVVKGSAVYSANFTPPTAPLTAVTNTKLLLNFTNAAIFDQTGKNAILTRGNAQLDTSVKKFGTASAEFDGTGDDLLLPPQPTLSFASDFTIEFFFNSDNVSGLMVLLASVSYYTAGKNGNWLIRISDNDQIAWASYNGSSGATAAYKEFTVPTMSTGTWYHLAVVRSSGSINVYFNGTVSSSGALSDTKNLIDGSVTGVYVGTNSLGANANFDGYIDELRITQKARYTSNFTAPTKEFPNR